MSTQIKLMNSLDPQDETNPALQDTSSLRLDDSVASQGLSPFETFASAGSKETLVGDPKIDDPSPAAPETLDPTPSMERSSSLFLRNVPRSSLEVFAFGRGDMHQLGLGEGLTDSHVPRAIPALSGKDIVSTAAGAYHSAAITQDGELFVWGSNAEGQCGGRNEEVVPTPKRIEALENFKLGVAACGASHTVTVAEDGSVFAFGSAEYGQLGLEEVSATKIEQPKAVKALKNARVARAAAGGNHSLVLTTGGAIMTFGASMFGALGRGDAPEAPERPRALPLWPIGITQIAAGESHSAALTAFNHVLTWGRGKSGTSFIQPLRSIIKNVHNACI